uniref:Prothymosin alpha n=1 Tax=Sus scrofa TaxID=9823 RepID=A0A8D1EMT7_PIG
MGRSRAPGSAPLSSGRPPAQESVAWASCWDLKEKKEVVEEAENGREAPANGNANEENGEQEADNEVDEEEEEGGEEEEEEEEGDGEEEDGDEDEEAEAATGKRAAEDDEVGLASRLESGAGKGGLMELEELPVGVVPAPEGVLAHVERELEGAWAQPPRALEAPGAACASPHCAPSG